MSQLDDFLDAALRLFSPDDGSSTLPYINPVAEVSDERLGADSVDDDDAKAEAGRLLDPLELLAAQQSRGEGRLNAPSVTFVVGQYGLGKTELTRQLCHQLRGPKSRRQQPLPVNLALCRDQLGLLERRLNSERDGNGDATLSRKDLFALLFSRVEPGLNSAQIPNLWSEVRQGKLVLILDGVDEFLGTWPLLKTLLSSLIHTLADGHDPMTLGFSVVVTMRLELLLALTGEHGSDLREAVASAARGAGIHCYFLQLRFLDDSRVYEYLDSRLGSDARRLFSEIKKNRPLMEMARRPLLLRILCDLATTSGSAMSFSGLENPGDLLKSFVERAAGDPALNQSQAQITRARWDPKALAARSLRLYENGRSELDREDIKEIFEARDGTDGGKQGLWPIHKIPFLHKPADFDKTGQVRFSHRVFFEFFVAYGMHLRVHEKGLTEFDQLVLNVDMRRFLSDLMGRETWLGRTRRSYALERDQLAEWHDPPLPFERLDEERKILLLSMTEPERYAKDQELREELESVVASFLSNEASMHPRYLVYNYEAVAVYIANQRWSDNAAFARKRLEPVLEKRLQSTLKLLKAPDDADLRSAWELVVERALSIGLRLRCAWLRSFKARQWPELIQDPATVRRIEALCKEIKDLQEVPP